MGLLLNVFFKIIEVPVVDSLDDILNNKNLIVFSSPPYIARLKLDSSFELEYMQEIVTRAESFKKAHKNVDYQEALSDVIKINTIILHY